MKQILGMMAAVVLVGCKQPAVTNEESKSKTVSNGSSDETQKPFSQRIELTDPTFGMSFEEKKAFKILMASAKKGDAESQLKIAIAYDELMVKIFGLSWAYKSREFHNLKTNIATAAKARDEKLLDQLDKEVSLFMDEVKIIKNRDAPLAAKEYEKWLIKSGEQGHSLAMQKLASLYQQGLGFAFPKNLKKSFELWHKAANRGNDNAQLQLGIAYSDGIGVRKDKSKALEWWTRAAKQGNSAAKTLLDLEQKSSSQPLSPIKTRQ